MKLLNVGCGGQRPQDEHWWNLDNLRQQLGAGTPERDNLDAEPRYIECDLLYDSVPGTDGEYDGILLQHVLEHFTCHEAVDVLMDCRRVLKPDGLLVASVPDASYFLSVYQKDTRESAVELFGESISGDWLDDQCEKFFDYALFHRHHKQLLTNATLICLLLRAGFTHIERFDLLDESSDVRKELRRQLNRLKFSAIVCATKQG